MLAECTDFIDAAEHVRNDIDREAQEAAANEEQTNQTERDPMIQIINEGAVASDDDETSNGETKALDTHV